MADSLNFGVIGMGHRGRLGWLRTLQLVPTVRVVAVCDAIPALREDGTARAGLRPQDAYADTDDLLARQDVDAVVIAVEPRNNAALVVRALEAGKHVLCEVPLALKLDDCWAVVRSVERSGKTFAMAEQVSYAPFVVAWRRLRELGRLGDISYGEAQYINGKGLDRYWQDRGTGARLTRGEARGNPNARKTHFWDLYHSILYAVHSLGPLLRVLDDRVVRVTCMATPRPSRFLRQAVGEDVPLPDLEVAMMQTAGGAILRLMVGFVSPYPGPEPHHWYHLLGTKGEVETGRRRHPGNAISGMGSLRWLDEDGSNGRAETEWEYSPYDLTALRAAQSGHGGLDFFPCHDFVESIVHSRSPTIDVYRAAELTAPAIIAGMSEEQGAAPLPTPDFRPGAGRAAGQMPATR